MNNDQTFSYAAEPTQYQKMGCEAGRCKTSTSSGIFSVAPSLEGWSTKTKKAPSPHNVRLALLDTNPVF